MKNLVIVESPSKSHTIEKYLGNDYKVMASKGHIRKLKDSGKYGFGIDTENGFVPSYEYISGKTSTVNELKKYVKNAGNVILATDPDREGEAISWHLKEVLGLKDKDYERVEFNEITKNAIIEALKHPRKIDMDLFRAQETRMFLDKIMGYRLSHFLKIKVPPANHAGRVQSVALKLIVDREREILAFVPEEYYTIDADFKDFKAELKKYQGKDIEIHTLVEAKEIISKLSNAFNIDKVESKEKKRQSKLPFTTSTLQQIASTRLKYSSSRTMSIAQKLYEGIDLGSERTGLITYMRTDSIRLSDEFVSDTKKYIGANYGKEYIGRAKSSKKTENVQDAHEAIRPTSILRTPESVKKYLKPEEYKLYELIYVRALSSLMADAVMNTTTIDLENKGYIFRANGSICIFDGYLKVYKDYEDLKEVILPNFENYKSKVIVCSKIEEHQHFTEPKSRYTEATLIAEMEKLGIGRPSTYATIMNSLTEKKKGDSFPYTNVQDRKFIPTELGFKVTDALQEFYKSYINVKYTAGMEEDLDKIADQKDNYIDVLNDFYNKFMDTDQKALNEKEKVQEETGEMCPKCGKPLVYKYSKNGKFIACSGYPGCKYIQGEEKVQEETGEICPECGKPLVYKKGKYGKFIACAGYPECKYIKKEEKKITEICDCPKCDGKVIEKKTKKGKLFYGCSNYPKCDFALWDKPTGEKCTECGGLMVDKKNKIVCSDCRKEQNV